MRNTSARYILLLFAYLLTHSAIAQSEISVTASCKGLELTIDIQNNIISGPSKIKFNTELGEIKPISLKGGQLKGDLKSNYSIVWFQVPEQAFQVVCSVQSNVSEVGNIGYLVDGEKVETPIKIKNTNTSTDQSNSTLTENNSK
jgi:hypothetical protein